MTADPSLKWIFFDLDDTLWDFKKASAESLRHVFGLFPFLGSPHGGGFEKFAEAYHLENDRLWSLHSQGKVTSDVLRAERWRRSVNADDRSEEMTRNCREVDTEYLRFLSSRPHAVDGMAGLLERLTEKVLVGIISNGFTDTQYRKLDSSGLWRWVTRTVISDETGIQKPSRRIFDYALRETGCRSVPFSDEAPVFVGDSFANDVAGAIRAGWRALWFNPQGRPLPETEEGVLVGNSPLFLGSARNAGDVSDVLERLIQA